jgi:hypothetical protein
MSKLATSHPEEHGWFICERQTNPCALLLPAGTPGAAGKTGRGEVPGPAEFPSMVKVITLVGIGKAGGRLLGKKMVED